MHNASLLTPCQVLHPFTGTLPIRQMTNQTSAQKIVVPAASLPHAAERIHELDGLRGLLAVFVALYHLLSPFPQLQAALRGTAPIFLEGWYAVDVFFVMSGFVMLHVYGKTFADRIDLGSLLRFLWARVVRLYPVHLFALLATLLLLLPMLTAYPQMFWSVDGRYSLGTLAGSLLMLQSPWVDYRSWNYPAWSISAEWHAYLFFPLLALLMRRCGGRLAGLLICLGVAVPLVLYLSPYQEEQYPTNGVAVLLRVLPLFVTGMALHRIWLSVRRVSAATAAVAVVGTLWLLCLPSLAPAAVVLVPLLVLSALRAAWLQRLLSSAPLLWLGKISYSLYMTHALVEGFVLSAGLRWWGRLSGAPVVLDVGGALLMWLAGAALAVVLGGLTWRWVEVPARTYLLRRSGLAAKRKTGTVDES